MAHDTGSETREPAGRPAEPYGVMSVGMRGSMGVRSSGLMPVRSRGVDIPVVLPVLLLPVVPPRFLAARRFVTPSRAGIMGWGQRGVEKSMVPNLFRHAVVNDRAEATHMGKAPSVRYACHVAH
jgi:hypothetical protein